MSQEKESENGSSAKKQRKAWNERSAQEQEASVLNGIRGRLEKLPLQKRVALLEYLLSNARSDLATQGPDRPKSDPRQTAFSAIMES